MIGAMFLPGVTGTNGWYGNAGGVTLLVPVCQSWGGGDGKRQGQRILKVVILQIQRKGGLVHECRSPPQIQPISAHVNTTDVNNKQTSMATSKRTAGKLI